MIILTQLVTCGRFVVQQLCWSNSCFIYRFSSIIKFVRRNEFGIYFLSNFTFKNKTFNFENRYQKCFLKPSFKNKHSYFKFILITIAIEI